VATLVKEDFLQTIIAVHLPPKNDPKYYVLQLSCKMFAPLSWMNSLNEFGQDHVGAKASGDRNVCDAATIYSGFQPPTSVFPATIDTSREAFPLYVLPPKVSIEPASWLPVVEPFRDQGIRLSGLPVLPINVPIGGMRSSWFAVGGPTFGPSTGNVTDGRNFGGLYGAAPELEWGGVSLPAGFENGPVLPGGTEIIDTDPVSKRVVPITIPSPFDVFFVTTPAFRTRSSLTLSVRGQQFQGQQVDWSREWQWRDACTIVKPGFGVNLNGVLLTKTITNKHTGKVRTLKYRGVGVIFFNQLHYDEAVIWPAPVGFMLILLKRAAQ
jgi:hypothetical protein